MSIEDDIEWVKANAGKMVEVKSPSMSAGRQGMIVGFRRADGVALIRSGGMQRERLQSVYEMVVNVPCIGYVFYVRQLKLINDYKAQRILKEAEIKRLEQKLETILSFSSSIRGNCSPQTVQNIERLESMLLSTSK